MTITIHDKKRLKLAKEVEVAFTKTRSSVFEDLKAFKQENENEVNARIEEMNAEAAKAIRPEAKKAGTDKISTKIAKIGVMMAKMVGISAKKPKQDR